MTSDTQEGTITIQLRDHWELDYRVNIWVPLVGDYVMMIYIFFVYNLLDVVIKSHNKKLQLDQTEKIANRWEMSAQRRWVVNLDRSWQTKIDQRSWLEPETSAGGPDMSAENIVREVNLQRDNECRSTWDELIEHDQRSQLQPAQISWPETSIKIKPNNYLKSKI